eukprot:TRINITY_DN4795_c0_g1_i1.p1 TRINITY_DN4795_c0_g1~~TRINITY_DN4795_c0_g1_i1.p1  ORF type:complete len:295 (+),score=59.42 TRINITY_DN4795_c0_g1_i1:232-1116(+)
MASDAKKLRLASHAGSWYTDDADELSQQLGKWLDAASLTDNNAKAIICPHAGYSYSGRTAAFSFKNIDKSRVKRIFVLGPSHHVYTTKCMLSSMTSYETPLGNIPLDTSVLKELHATGHFEWMDKKTDEDEHSIEMQLPYIEKVMKGGSYSLVPVMIGSTNRQAEELYGSIFAKYLESDENFFVISSDFCHWGARFDYRYIYKEGVPIHESIEALDRMAMKIIETKDPEDFGEYLKKHKNTICGRHPIGVFLNAMKQCKREFTVKFVHYEQSSRCQSKSDSSVSYAAGVITLDK